MKTTTRRFGPSAIDRTVSNWPRIDPRGAQALMYANIGDFKHLFDWYRQWRKPIEARFASSVVVTLWPGSQQGRQHPQVFSSFFRSDTDSQQHICSEGKRKCFDDSFLSFFLSSPNGKRFPPFLSQLKKKLFHQVTFSFVLSCVDRCGVGSKSAATKVSHPEKR